MKKTHIFRTLTRSLIPYALLVLVLAVSEGKILGATLPTLTGPNLMLHLKSDSGITLNGSTVSQWDDLSGLGNHFEQGAAVRQPLLVNNVLNGQPVLRFDGANDWMSVIGSGLNGIDLPFSFFAVTTNTTNPRGLFDSAPNVQNPFRFFNHNQVEFWNTNPVLPLNLQSTGSVISVRGSLGPNRLLELRELSPLGVVDTSAAGSSATQVDFGGNVVQMKEPTIGAVNQSNNFAFSGDLAELIIYKGTLNNTQRGQVEEYLRTQYNLGPIPPPTPVIPSALGNYGQSILSSGPVGFWRLETNEGTTAADTANVVGPPQQGPQDGSYQDLSLHNRGQAGPRPTDLVGGQPLVGFAADNHATDFQGNASGGNDVVIIPDDGNLDFSSGGAFSIEAWVKSDGGSDSGGAVIGKGIGGSGSGQGEQFAIDIFNGKFRFFVRNNGGAVKVLPTNVSVDGSWQHIVATFDISQSLMKFYVNGDEVGSTTPPISLLSNNHEVSIGARKNLNSPNYDLNFDGLIDEVSIYGRALSEAEIDEHFDAAFVPEPSSIMLALAGFIGLAGLMRRRRCTLVM